MYNTHTVGKHRDIFSHSKPQTACRRGYNEQHNMTSCFGNCFSYCRINFMTNIGERILALLVEVRNSRDIVSVNYFNSCTRNYNIHLNRYIWTSV